VIGWLDAVPGYAVPAVVALVLVAESGLLIGILLPAASLLLGLGVLAGAGLVPVPVVGLALLVAGATVLGAALGHRTAALAGAGAGSLLPTGGRLGRLLPERARETVDRSALAWAGAIGRRPVRVAAMSQLVAGARTLAPRVAVQAGVPLRVMLRGTIPAALLWSWGLVGAGAVAGAALPLLRCSVAAAGIPLVIAATWLLLRRKANAVPA
jgi:membrane-associated protein